jgi:hypothetical protein
VCDGAFRISQNRSFAPYAYGSHYIQWQNSGNSEMRWHDTNVKYVDRYFMCSFCDGKLELPEGNMHSCHQHMSAVIDTVRRVESKRWMLYMLILSTSTH